MKKIVLCFSLFTFLVTAAQAQTRIAIAGGVHSSSVNTDDDDDADEQGFDSRTGFHAGFLLDIPLSTRFSFQPSVWYTQKGREFDRTEGAVHTTGWQYANYIEVPLNFVFKAPLGEKAKFLLGAGPYAGFLAGGRERTVIDGVVDEQDDLPTGEDAGQYKSFDYGWNALAGFEFGRFFVTANYSRGLADFYNPGDASNYRHQVIGGTIGIFLNSGKPKVLDRDGDGVLDADDQCPDEAGGVATRGCPDRDSDGIADKDDRCPDQAGTAKYNGCPIPDSDGDGINDENDKCPNQAGTEKYQGCPVPDSDGDGLDDEKDQCPNQAGPERNNGCPIADTDGDGLNDEEDRCPTVAGTRENNGCPELNSKLVDKVGTSGRSIQFSSASSSTLTAASKTTLNNIAQILQENPELKITVEGHVSDNGNADQAMTLSTSRAEAVKDYLVSQGISAERITTNGYGATQPVSTTKSKNMRIELKLSNQ